MNIFRKKNERIKNQASTILEKDFQFNPFSFILLLAGMTATLGSFRLLATSADSQQAAGLAICYMITGLVMFLLPIWSIVIALILIQWAVMAAVLGIDSYTVYAVFALCILIAGSIQMVYHWDKAVILRLGKYRKTRDAGLYLLMPVLDRVADIVDTRIRVTDFCAEKTLTRDNVPVHIDAICFWMIWDAKKAILEVQDYVDAVTLSAQTALRDSIGSNELSVLLSEREKVGGELQRILDAKTNPWGITILSVEFTDIIIPGELEDAMSKRAQAEREKQARVILGSAESEVAARYAEAAETYQDNPVALNLRAMSMVYDGLKQNKGSIMLLPSSALESMNLGSILGTAAIEKLHNKEQES